MFRLILLYTSWYTDNKELIQRMQTPTTNTKLHRLLSQDHCVSRGRQVSDSASARRSGTCATLMRVTLNTPNPHQNYTLHHAHVSVIAWL